MSRLFGTDGIRGVANVDLKPTTGLRARAGRRPSPGRSRAARSSSARTRVARATCSWPPSRPGRPASASTSTSSASSRRRPSRSSPGAGPFAAGIMVSASHNPADDNGLKVLDAHGLKLDDAIEDELEQLDLADRGARPASRTTTSAGWSTRATRLDDYRAHRLGLAPSRSTRSGAAARPRRGERLGLGGRAARSWRRPAPGRGHPRRPGRDQHQRPLGRDRTRRRSPRPSSRPAPTSASPSTATPTG